MTDIELALNQLAEEIITAFSKQKQLSTFSENKSEKRVEKLIKRLMSTFKAA